MLRRHRFGVPALLVVVAYAVAVMVAAVIASATGDLGVLWRLTLFMEVDEGVAGTWPNVLALILFGALWAWALWQSLRGPLTGPPPEPDRDARRLRGGLYASAATWLLYFLMSSWPWWTRVLDAVVMLAVVVLFHPVVAGDLRHADRVRATGALAYGGAAAGEVLDALDWPDADWLFQVCGLAALIWTLLVLRAQRRDERWRRATVRYGAASLAGSALVGLPLVDTGVVYEAATVAADALTLIWLARSAHELAEPRPLPAAPAPVREAS
ncbi:hypothetical protein [Microbispora sp. NPDC049125]|uniref:hypothetical protein n=1 Tax=Microbispora sp. NPDC049125 TaxID=3154929 RepID=UPI003467A16E